VAVLVTGSAGFIGFHTALRLLRRGEEVVGLDNLNAYYDPNLKAARLAVLEREAGYKHARLDLADREGVSGLFEAVRPHAVVNLAAQAGVRYSLDNPHAYAAANLQGFLNVLEGCRAAAPRHLVFASTSSAYGANGKLPFDIHEAATHPITLYAATKLANEGMAHAYAHLFGFPCTGLRFFTVYGPWGRPDMSPIKFLSAILEGRPIDVYGEGRMRRDFTYVDDIVDGVVAALDRPPAADPAWDPLQPDPATSGVAPWRLFNLGAGRPVELMRYIQVFEAALGRKAILNLMPMQPGDVTDTHAEIGAAREALGYEPKVSIEEGVSRFVAWYLDFYGRP
jgi:UDP-glucuronate 4-epimerase